MRPGLMADRLHQLLDKTALLVAFPPAVLVVTVLLIQLLEQFSNLPAKEETPQHIISQVSVQ